MFLLFGLSLLAAFSEVRLPQIFGNHMVLQRDRPLVFWGWAEPNSTVTVKLAGNTRTVSANARGEWKATLPSITAGGPYTLTISGPNEVRFENILIGEVWLCSGQSNMEMGIASCLDAQKEIAAADHPNLRLFMVENRWTPEPQSDLQGQWKVCSPKTVAEGGWGGFSAAAYYFGRELQKKLGVAIGLIDATWGGTRIESWTPPEGFGLVPALQKDYEAVQLGDARTPVHREKMEQFLATTEQWLAQAREALANQKPSPKLPAFPPELLPPQDLHKPTALFNGMIHPVCPFPIRGAIWYQGESNSGEGMLYTERMKALVAGWRKIWDYDDLAFYFVQIAPFNYGGNPEVIGEFWEAQAAAEKAIPNSGMVVINDIGDLKDIHPANKQEVGRRLALLALNRTYGHKEIGCAGPAFESMAIEGDKLRVAFDNSGSRLSTRDGKPPTWFEIIDANDGGFVPADARIEGASVVLSSKQVPKPVALRFAWSMLAEPNLVNSDGLPAGAFRAGPVPKRDLLELKVREAREYTLLYDLDLAKLGPEIHYDQDHRTQITKPFDRVAYFLELQKGEGNTDYVFVSCDAFTASLEQLGIPTLASGARFQQDVPNLNVYSNVRGITAGTNLAGGNIEFWPNNYGTDNAANVSNASGSVYDFGDQPTNPADGYGCMQFHNHHARQTLFALNHWRGRDRADLGIGTQPVGNPDWTFAANAGSYKAKRLRVFVRTR